MWAYFQPQIDHMAQRIAEYQWLGQQKGSYLPKIFDMILNGKQSSQYAFSNPFYIAANLWSCRSMARNYMGCEQAYRCLTVNINMYLGQLRKIKNPNQKERENAYGYVLRDWRQRQKQCRLSSPDTHAKPLTLSFLSSILY